MKKALAVFRWVKHPHWTWQLVGWAFGLAVVVCWALTGTFFRGLGAVLTLLAGWFGIRAVRWIVGRVRVTRDAGIPLSPVRMVKELAAERAKFADADEKWAIGMSGQKVSWNGVSPGLKRKTLTPDGSVRASVNAAAIGGDLNTITRLAADGTLAGIMDCKEVTVNPSGRSGKATLTFWKTPPLSGRDLVVADLPPSGKGRVSFGFAAEGGAASFRNGLSVLAVGTTGTGKSILFKNAFIDWRRDNYPMEMYFINPKIVEFAQFKALAAFGAMIGNIKIAGYAETPAEADEMCKTFLAEMRVRQQRLADMGLYELKHPTPDFPARVIACDEMADVKEIFAKIDQAGPLIISKGRATLDSIFGMAQLAKIETLGTVRDNVALRAGLRMMTPENTKAALGISENDGAPCSRIPLNMPGMGYYVTEDGTVGKFRTGKVSDKDWADVLAGGLPAGMPVNVEDIGPPCFVYVVPHKKSRLWSRRCGYIGVAEGDPKNEPVRRRYKQHRRNDVRWCAEHEQAEYIWRIHLDYRNMQVKKYPSRAAALIAEERLIKELKPVWNIQHNGGNPDSNENMAKRIIEQRTAQRAGVKTRLRDAASEWRELGREHRVARRAELAAAHQERVARLQAERDQFVQTVTGL